MMIVNMWIVLLTLALMTHQAFGINCFNCVNELSNNDCSAPEHVADCDSVAPTGTKYDICQTIITNTGTPDERITKKCAVGPCYLADNQQNALGLECAGNRCMECCQTNECNRSGAGRVVPGAFVSTLMMFVAIWHVVVGEVAVARW